MASFKINDRGLKSFQRRFSRTRFNAARQKATFAGAKYAKEQLILFSRVDRDHYRNRWKIKKLGDGKYEIFNDAEDEDGRPYAVYVTANTQYTIWTPQGEAGAAMIRHVTRAIRPEMRRIIKKVFLEEITR